MSSDAIVLLVNECHVETLLVCGNDICNNNPPSDESPVTQNPVRRITNSMYRVTSLPLDKYSASAQRRIEIQDGYARKGGSSTHSQPISCWRRFCFSHWAIII